MEEDGRGNERRDEVVAFPAVAERIAVDFVDEIDVVCSTDVFHEDGWVNGAAERNGARNGFWLWSEGAGGRRGDCGADTVDNFIESGGRGVVHYVGVCVGVVEDFGSPGVGAVGQTDIAWCRRGGRCW